MSESASVAGIASIAGATPGSTTASVNSSM